MPPVLQRAAAWLTDRSLYLLVSFLTGIRPKPKEQFDFPPERNVYYANHGSHGDFVMVWISLPKPWRDFARPVAGADYWLKGKVRSFVINQVFKGLLIMRNGNDPKAITQQMSDALADKHSLIIFPEGTRNTSDDITLLPFKSGIYHLARANPDVRFVPIWIENINRVLPKGQLVPLPIACDVVIGQPLQLQPDEDKEAFLNRSREALLALSPQAKAQAQAQAAASHDNRSGETA